MKNILIYSGLVAVILFVDYILIALIGCFANACGAGNDFFCGPFCYIGLSILTISSVLTGAWLLKRRSRFQHE